MIFCYDTFASCNVYSVYHKIKLAWLGTIICPRKNIKTWYNYFYEVFMSTW